MSYRSARKSPPKRVADRQYMKAPPPTPPEFDPQAREPADNTIGEQPEQPNLMRLLTIACDLFLGLPPQSRPSPKWDSLPVLPARVRRIVYMFRWGPPNEVACAICLTAGWGFDGALMRGRQEWSFPSFHANKTLDKRLSIQVITSRNRAPQSRSAAIGIGDGDGDEVGDCDDDETAGDSDDEASFVGTEDGFEES
jgi:hypothetical protein